MLPGMELMGCQNLAVPAEVMHHVVHVESSFNPYAIGVVGGRLVRQPRTLPEALATVRMLEARGFNFSLGLAQVNRANLARYGLDSYERAFQPCPNLQAGSRILAECHARAGGDWGRAFSCYYSGNFTTGFRHGYVGKVFASMQAAGASPVADPGGTAPIDVVGRPSRRMPVEGRFPLRDEHPAATGHPAYRTAPTARVAVGAPASAPGGDATPQVAIVSASGEPPRLVPASGGAPPAGTPAPPEPGADRAFVF